MPERVRASPERERVRHLLGHRPVDVGGRGREPIADVVGIEFGSEEHADHNAPDGGLDVRREVEDFTDGQRVDHAIEFGEHDGSPS